MCHKTLYQPVDLKWIERLTRFFELIKSRKEDTYFHPHPFTKIKAQELGHYTGHDLYFVQTMENEICGYGMLRGWDEGYLIPFLGIIIHPDFRGRGLGENFMGFLHDQARQKGAKQIKLKVYPENQSAIALYKKMGYAFSGIKEGQLPGYATL